MQTFQDQFRFQRYFGPNIRCGFASIEIRFPAPDAGPVDWSEVSGLLDAVESDAEYPSSGGSYDFAEALGRLAAILQGDADSEWAAGHEAGDAWVCLACRNPMVTQGALVLASRALQQIQSRDARLLGALKQQLTLAKGGRPDHITSLLEAEAADRGIPVYAISPHTRIQQYGQGECGRQFKEAAQESDGLTGHLLSVDKRATNEFLGRLGFPHTVQLAASSEPQAAQAAQHLGFPCVLKPGDRGMGLGITVNVTSPGEVAQAFATARQSGRGPVLVEKQVPGHDHRMAVFGGNLAWVYRRTPPRVIGDGTTTLRGLIDNENASRPIEEREVGLVYEIRIDEGLLQFVRKQGLTLDSIVPAGREVSLRGQANLAQGGMLDDVTANVHPDNRDMAEQVAKAFRLDAMGLDFMTSDISRSWQDGHGAIIEVNATPGLSGASDAYQVMKARFPFRNGGRVPACLVVGEECDDHAHGLKSSLQTHGLVVGSCIGEETMVGDSVLAGVAKKPVPMRAMALALNPRTQAIVIGARVAELREAGLPLDRFDLAVTDATIRSADPILAGILEAACGTIIQRNDLSEEVLRDCVSECIERHRQEAKAQSDLIAVTGAPTLSTGEEPPTIATELEAWRMPCIPIGAITTTVETLLQTTLDRNGGAHLLTQDLAPRLVAEWTHAILALTGHPAGDVMEFTRGRERHESQTKSCRYRLRFPPGELRALEMALRWSVTTLNHMVHESTRGRGPETCAAALGGITTETLADLRRIAS